jgi:nucleotide-binding universal stress UspA family protein
MTAPLVTVGMDGSVGAFRALDAAAAEAQLRGARLDVLYCVKDADEAEPVLRAARTRVAQRCPELPVTLCGPVGDPVVALARAGRSSVLTVVGCRDREGAPGLPTHSVGRRLAAQAHGPLLVVRGRRSRGPAGRHRILLAVESDDDTEAAVFAFEEADLRHVPLRFLHAWTYRPLTGRPPALPWPDTRAPRSVGLSTHTAGGCGYLITATGNADLVVVAGQHHRHAWNGRRLGPVTDVLLRQSLCPVAVVPGPSA